MASRRGTQHHCLLVHSKPISFFYCLDWGFIEHTLIKMGFPTKFKNYVMNCITSVSYSINFNGVAHAFIKPTRGLRQGDPLSPYIFILCVEILSSNLGVLEQQAVLRDIRIGKNAPSILHLMYADDLLITCNADPQSCLALQQLLHQYSTSVRQAINKGKSSIIHHPRLDPELAQQLQHTFNIPTTSQPPSYLGIQFRRGRSSAHLIVELLNRIERKAKGWISKCVNQAGRLVLIKTALSPTTNHVMQAQQLPCEIHNKIDKITRDFFWGHDAQTRKMHPIGWEQLTTPIALGGLGIRKSKEQNQALLLKRVWQLHKSGSIWANICTPKYLHPSNNIHSPIPPISISIPEPQSSASYFWKCLANLSSVLQDIAFYQIKDGLTTTIYNHWIPHNPPTHPPSSSHNLPPNTLVAQLIDQPENTWNHSLINHFFHPNMAPQIKNIHLPTPQSLTKSSGHIQNMGTIHPNQDTSYSAQPQTTTPQQTKIQSLKL